MADDTRATAFVTGADEFLGTELIKLLAGRGHQVVALARPPEAAQTVRRAGARPFMSDVRTPGPWQDEAAAGWVLHLEPAQPVHPIRMRVLSIRISHPRSRTSTGLESPHE